MRLLTYTTSAFVPVAHVAYIPHLISKNYAVQSIVLESANRCSYDIVYSSSYGSRLAKFAACMRGLSVAITRSLDLFILTFARAATH